MREHRNTIVFLSVSEPVAVCEGSCQPPQNRTPKCSPAWSWQAQSRAPKQGFRVVLPAGRPPPGSGLGVPLQSLRAGPPHGRGETLATRSQEGGAGGSRKAWVSVEEPLASTDYGAGA